MAFWGFNWAWLVDFGNFENAYRCSMVRYQIKEALLHSNCFHAEWYLSQYKHLLDEGVEPLDDYIDVGFKAGRNPNFIFDNKHYLNQVSGLAAAEGNPLLHYCVEGWGQFFDPGPEFNSWWYCVQHMGGRLDQNPLVHFLEKGNSQGLSTTLAAGQVLSVSDKVAFNSRSISLFQSLSMTAELASRVADSVARLGQYDLADMFVAKACELEPDNPAWFVQLARIMPHRNGWNRMLQAMHRALELEPNNAEWWALAGSAAERLERYEVAISYYKKSVELGLNDANYFYHLGRCQSVFGDQQAAVLSYQSALELSGDNVRKLGMGGLHESNEEWSLAAQAYGIDASQQASAELHYHHGRMLELEYRWEEAEKALLNAIALASNPHYYYRLGCVLERLERFEEAACSYKQAIESCGQEESDWYYRLGNALFRTGAYQDACQAWMRALPADGSIDLPPSINALRDLLLQDRQNSDLHILIGLFMEKSGALQEASEAYAEAIARRSEYSPYDYYYLGRALSALGRYKDACLAFQEIRLVKRLPSPAVDVEDLDVKQQYAECLETLEVRDGVILYESYHGDSVSCNPYALFLHLIRHPSCKDYLHVWVVKSEDCIPVGLKAFENVVFVRRGSHGYIRYLATARYLVNNSTFPPYFMRRDGQKYLNTWHGTPLKCLGYDMPGLGFEHKNVVRNLLHVTHFIYPNVHTFDSILRSYKVDDLYQGRCLGTGQPRIDLMLGADESRRQKLRSILGISNDLPVLLYAPTWRGSMDSPDIQVEELLSDVQALKSCSVNVVISVHNFVRRNIDLSGLGVACLEGVDTTEFLSVVDILVTDYSSVLFDFLPLRRPIILYVHDLEEYKVRRGLYFDIGDLPAFVCDSRTDLCGALYAVLKGERVSDAALDAAIQKFCPWEDGAATVRAAKFFLDDIGGESVPSSGRRKLLFYAGPFAPNGITSSFVQLVSKIDPERNCVYVSLDPWLLESYPQRMQRFRLVSDGITPLGRISYPVATAEEQWLDEQFSRSKGDLSRHGKSLLVGMYKREYRRLYGGARFDAVIDFCGYDRFWTRLFAWGRSYAVGVQWLHNDMLAERQSRFPSLQSSFRTFENFDRLISVSEEVNRVNRENFSVGYKIPEERFVSVPNLIDPEWLKSKAEAMLPTPLKDWIDDAELLIGTVARLSPEKGIDRLIDAFSAFVVHYPAARLVIAGHGSLRDDLLQKINKLGLEGNVRLAGYMENPYPLMKRLDVFVLPSRYEGQGIVLLEALVLGCAVIATDIPGVHGVLKGTRGLLVDSSVEGLLGGLRRFAKDGLADDEFDADSYVQAAINSFQVALQL